MPVAAVVTVNGLASPPEQMVCVCESVPAETLFTVTVSGLEVTTQGTPFNVLVMLT